MRGRTLILALLCASVLTGPAQAQPAAPTPAALSPAAGGPPAWVAFKQTWSTIASYTATVAVFEREGTQVQSTVLDYSFTKPSTATVHFTEGVNAGVTVVWNGGATVVAHRGSGFMGLFTKTFPLHDPQVTTIRGSSIDQLSFAAIIAHPQSMAGTVSQEPGPMVLGIPTEAITLVLAPSAADTGLTRETVDIAVPTNLPVRIIGYQGTTLVRQIVFSNIKLQPAH